MFFKAVAGFLFIGKLLYAECTPTGVLTANVLLKTDYTAILPLKIAGITVLQGRLPDIQNSVGSPICICPFPVPPMVRIGIPISLFEPSRLIEVNKDPYCFHMMGFGLPLSEGLKTGTKGDGADKQRTFFQAHYYVFPFFAILEMFMDFVCMERGAFDMGYITEVDILWNDDSLSAIINPEALVFGNPITHMACLADSVSAQASTPLDALFWCKGSWGNAYPLTGNTTTNNYIEDSAAVASSLIYKLHRQLILWGSWGELGLCGYFPAPIWRKSSYRLQFMSPLPHPLAITIGTMGQTWSFGKHIPFKGDNYGYLLFKKRDCCAF